MNTTDLASAIRGGLIQQDRLIKTDIPALPPDTMVPRRAIVSAELGRDFSVTLDLMSSADDVELKTLIAQPITLWLRQADRTYLPINGYIHTARRLGADGSLTSYQLTFASWLHFLRFRRDLRCWQDQSADAIITDVFNAHPQASGRFTFTLSKPLPARSYCRQSETAWNFVHRLMEDEGLYGFWRHDADGSAPSFVVVDDIHALDTLPGGTVRFARAGTGDESDALTQWAGTRTLQSVAYTTRSFDYKAPSVPSNPKGTTLPTRADQGALPGQLEIYEYTGAYTFDTQQRGDHLSKLRLEEWESRAKRFDAVGGVYALDAGLRFTLTGHPEHDADAAAQREFAALKVCRYIENNLPPSAREASFPHGLKAQLEAARQRSADEAAGAAATGLVTHEDGSAGFYRVEVEAQRTTVPYHSPFEHAKPEMALETAIVTGPSGEEVHTDALNRIRIRFIWDRLDTGDGQASCWVRVTQADTGGGYGGVHMPRVGEEVAVGYLGGDCDRPIVLHRVYNGSVKPQWHSNGLLSGFRSKEYAGGGYNQMVMDDATGQNRAQLMSSSANSMLQLGYQIEQSGNTRGAYLGSGFDLRTDAYGAVRASRGLYLSTHAKPAGSQPLDVDEAHQQLQGAGSLIEAMSAASVQHQAETLQAGQDALRQFTDGTRQSRTGSAAAGGLTAGGGTGSANGFGAPLMLFGSPDGIALASQQSIHLAANQQINLVGGASAHLVAGKSLLASVVERLSLFVQNAGAKLFAARGKVEIQAQADNLELTAQKTLKLVAATQQIEVAADQELLLSSGGAYLRLKGGNIEIHAPGRIDVKGAAHAFSGPTQLHTNLGAFKQTAGPYDQALQFKDELGQPVPNLDHLLQMRGDLMKTAASDQGSISRVFSQSPDPLKAYLHVPNIQVGSDQFE